MIETPITNLSTNYTNKVKKTTKHKLIYKDETYQIAGILFNVYNELGYGFREKYYQNSVAKELEDQGINFRRELYIPLVYKGQRVGKYYIDFLINNQIALEIKIARTFYKSHIAQILSYLEAKNLKLGILAIFSPKGLKFKRIIN